MAGGRATFTDTHCPDRQVEGVANDHHIRDAEPFGDEVANDCTGVVHVGQWLDNQ